MTSTFQPVRFGIIGLGYGLSRCQLILEGPETELVAVAGRSPGKVAEAASLLGVAGYSDYRILIERDDIDAIGLYTPSGTHLEIAEEIARAGKHLVVTKPIDITIDRVDRILAAFDSNGLRLASEFIFRYQPANHDLHLRIQNGELGVPVLGEFSYKCYRSQAYYESDGGWRGTWAVDGGGALMNQAIHIVDQMLWNMGPAISVVANIGTFTHDIETEDTVTALVEFESGAHGVLVATTTFRNNQPPHTYGNDLRRIEVHGSEGSVGLEEGSISLWAMESGSPTPAPSGPDATNVFQDMARWIADPAYESPTLVTGEAARDTVALVLAVYESARANSKVYLANR